MAPRIFRCARCCVWTGEIRYLASDSVACEESELQAIDGVVRIQWEAPRRAIQLSREESDAPSHRVLTIEEDAIRTIDVYCPSPFSMIVIVQVDASDTTQQCFLVSHISTEDSQSEDLNSILRLSDRREMLAFLSALHSHLKSVPLTSAARDLLAQKQTQDATRKTSLLKHRRSLSPMDFYGRTSLSPTSTPPSSKKQTLDSSAWTSFYERLQYNVSHSLMCQLEGTAPLSASFPRQQEAFEFADQVVAFRERVSLQQKMTKNDEDEPRVFCFEGANEGKRRFWVTTLRAFWKEYTAIPYGSRHVYEIIREGVPCRLYFDLEFKKKLNPGVDGDALVTRLISLVQLHFYRLYQLVIHRETHVVELESSTPEKFSRHLTIHFPNGELFADNIHAGAFVRQLVHELVTDDDNSPFLVHDSTNDGAQRQLFIDVGVYTRNRMFRVLGSSKFRKTAMLRSLGSCASDGDAALDRDLFLRSIVCPRGSRPDAASTIRLVRCDDAVSLKRYAATGGVSCMPYTSMRSVESRASIFPALDAFIRAIATTGGPQGEIRAVHLLYADTDNALTSTSEAGLPVKIVYHMMKNRWCENVGRAHKSNNVMFVVDIDRREYVQRCHDPNCHAMDYRSPPRPLPVELEINVTT